MILVDTNVFLDIWTRDVRWGTWSEDALVRAAEADALAVNPVIYSELAIGFERDADLKSALSEAGIHRLQLPYEAAWIAARAFAEYRRPVKGACPA